MNAPKALQPAWHRNPPPRDEEPTGGPLRVTKTMQPGQPGTLKLARRHGPGLVCVRYREDATGQTRYTTIELVVDEAPVQRRISMRTIVGVRIAWGEAALSARAKAMGAKWDSASRLWRMSLRTALALDLADRVTVKLPIPAHRA
ncbi:MAG: hypothetical protein Q8K96_17445 [Rubrivivax sp.]|nr:hypothetical protein [Rubrivivax sp.]